MNSKHCILIFILINIYFKQTIQATTKTTKKNIKTTLATTKPTELSKCYLSREGTLNNKIINETSKEITCKTKCLSARSVNGTSKMDYNVCQKENEKCENSTGWFIVRNNYTLKTSCCSTNLCNTPEFHAKSLNFKCESNKQVTKNMKLIYKVRDLKAKTVKQCYICYNCTKESEFEIVNCAKLYPESENFACEVINNFCLKNKFNLKN
jgi:hypothetical protein